MAHVVVCAAQIHYAIIKMRHHFDVGVAIDNGAAVEIPQMAHHKFGLDSTAEGNGRFVLDAELYAAYVELLLWAHHGVDIVNNKDCCAHGGKQ
jgi:hypothetical protein